MTPPMVLDGPMNGVAFLAYIEQLLVPTLSPGDTVIMDMCGRPRLCKKNLLKSKERGRGLTCVRPLSCGHQMPRARMGVRGAGPIQSGALVARIHDLVLPIPSR
ncbi:hypothetical protein GGI59_006596 [Rhizobium lentis]|uniref:Transposase n=1 Tax=Rhizobium lentis TaxID=1138194 RepID=A0A7W8XL45_9HYPH|nr:hypothetical protein [Rhizobium lentis]MBB5554244.1 hypothetical protein [Rhizobium lentis]MBB5564878.1 hypothetical protein [Rhizobium lentis]MBB5571388.1 hypothetical protein [Rhizobium lentis]